MMFDARTLSDDTTIETDLCIVGAGVAGISLARECIGHNFSVCLLEAGGLEPDRVTQSLYCALINQAGKCAFITVDVDPYWRRRLRPPGRYISTVWIPGNLLGDGKHYVNAFLLTLNTDMLEFSAKPATSFNVVDSFDGDTARGDYFRPIGGAVRPLLKWTTDFQPSSQG